VPLFPKIVRVEPPAGVVDEVVIVSVEVPDPETDVGLNDPVVPVGKPLALRFVLPLNPAIAEIVTL
jgi:hypothetical protein